MGTIAFEMTFWLLVLFRRTRLIAAVTGIIFHNMTGLFMGITFWNLQIMYVAFIPWERIASGTQPPSRPVRYWLVLTVGTALLITNLSLGALCIEAAWPCACYPTFAGPPTVQRGDIVHDIVIVRILQDGTEQVVPKERIFRYIQPQRFDGLFDVALSRGPQEMELLGETLGRLLGDAKLRIYQSNGSFLEPANTEKTLLWPAK